MFIIVHNKTCFEIVWGSKQVITRVITGKKRGLNESRAIIFFNAMHAIAWCKYFFFFMIEDMGDESKSISEGVNICYYSS